MEIIVRTVITWKNGPSVLRENDFDGFLIQFVHFPVERKMPAGVSPLLNMFTHSLVQQRSRFSLPASLYPASHFGAFLSFISLSGQTAAEQVKLFIDGFTFIEVTLLASLWCSVISVSVPSSAAALEQMQLN